MLPPMNAYSMEQMATLRPASIVPSSVTIASFNPVADFCVFRENARGAASNP